MTVLDFLTGGIYTNLRELIEACVQWLITFITNTSANFYTPLINQVLALVPVIDDLAPKIQYVFDFVSPYVSFIIDMLFISRVILNYLILSLIFRVTIRFSSYLFKLGLKWYKAIFP